MVGEILHLDLGSEWRMPSDMAGGLVVDFSLAYARGVGC